MQGGSLDSRTAKVNTMEVMAYNWDGVYGGYDSIDFEMAFGSFSLMGDV